MSGTSRLKLSGELSLRNQGFMGPLRSAVGGLNQLRTQAGPTGAAIRTMTRDLAGAAVALYAGKKALDVYLKGVALAKKEASSRIDLRIAMKTEGEAPEVLTRRLKEMRAVAFEVSKDATGSLGDIEQAAARMKKLGQSDAMIKGGLLRSASLLADASGQTKEAAASQIIGFAAPFKARGKETMGFAELLSRAQLASRFKDVASIGHEMEFAAPAAAQMGMSKEGLAAWMATVGDVRTFGAGRAFRSGLNQLLKAKPSDLRKIGVNKLTDLVGEGGEFDPAKLSDALKKKMGGKSKLEVAQILTKVFDAESAVAFQALLSGDIRAKERLIAGRPGLESQLFERKKTAAFQEQRVKGTIETGISQAFKPGEKIARDIWKGIGDKIVDPAAGAVFKNEGVQKGITYGTGGAALGLGVLGLGLLGHGGAALLKGAKGAGGFKKMFFPDVGTEVKAIAKAKLYQKTIGAQPVVVVNVADFFHGGGIFGGAGRGNYSPSRAGDLAAAERLFGGGSTNPAAWKMGLTKGQWAGGIGGGLAVAAVAAPVVMGINSAIDKKLQEGGGGIAGKAAALGKFYNPFKIWDDATRAAGLGYGYLAGDEKDKKLFGHALKEEGVKYAEAWSELFGGSDAERIAADHADAAQTQKEAAQMNDQASKRIAAALKNSGGTNTMNRG